jgi:hypothetical protein
MNELQVMANEAFQAIEKNTGESFPHATVKEAFESFQSITATKGVAWLIDAATGTGMSHLGWTYWMSEARKRRIVKVKVEMRHAYQWTCESCGCDQFETAMVAEFNEEDRLETAKRCGLIEEFATEVPEELQGDFVTHPERVTCNNCGASFETKDPHDDEDGEYDGESASD